MSDPRRGRSVVKGHLGKAATAIAKLGMTCVGKRK